MRHSIKVFDFCFVQYLLLFCLCLFFSIVILDHLYYSFFRERNLFSFYCSFYVYKEYILHWWYLVPYFNSWWDISMITQLIQQLTLIFVMVVADVDDYDGIRRQWRRSFNAIGKDETNDKLKLLFCYFSCIKCWPLPTTTTVFFLKK